MCSKENSFCPQFVPYDNHSKFNNQHNHRDLYDYFMNKYILHFDIEQDVGRISKNYEKNGYGLKLEGSRTNCVYCMYPWRSGLVRKRYPFKTHPHKSIFISVLNRNHHDIKMPRCSDGDIMTQLPFIH